MEVTERRTRTDWARVVPKLVDEDYADKERIVLVMDNLNTHHPASLYQTFEPAKARRTAERLEIHYTPKHGSWLNIAEIELGVLARQCLDRRIPGQEILEPETKSGQDQRNRDSIRVDCRFTTAGRPHQTEVPLPINPILMGLLAGPAPNTPRRKSPSDCRNSPAILPRQLANPLHNL